LQSVVTGSSASELGQLSPGAYALHARAIDTSCQVFAAGCDAFVVSDESSRKAEVWLALLEARLLSCGPGEICSQGACRRDGGDGDADADADGDADADADGDGDGDADGDADADADGDADGPCEDDWLCLDSCERRFDGRCDDGGPGAATTQCALGSDCRDCGTRCGSCATDGCPCNDSKDCAVGTCLSISETTPGCTGAICVPSCETDEDCRTVAGDLGSEAPAQAYCLDGRCDLFAANIGDYVCE
jgi:hypothetical protein